MAIQIKSPEYLSIDINQGKVRKAICINQKDTVNRTIVARITDSGTALDLSNLLFAEIFIAKSDGYETDQGCIIDGSTVQYTLKSNDVSALGTNTAQFMLTFSDGTILTTPTFEINVYSKVLDTKAQKSFNEYTSITQQVVLANEYRSYAENSAENAQNSATNALASANSASDSEEKIAEYTNRSEAAADAALNSETNAKASEEVSVANTESVTTMMNSVSEMQDTTKGYMESSKASATNASTSEANAKSSETAAELSKTNAAVSETNALEYSENSNKSYMASRSYAVGDTGTRAGEELDNAKYYLEQARTVVKSGGLNPCGTTKFASIPTADIQIGDMYNISDAFVSDERFKDGAGVTYQEGSNIYWTADGMWDVMSPNMSNYLLKQGDSMSNTVTFTDAASAEYLESGESHATLFGKINAYLKYLKKKVNAAFDDITNLKAADTELDEKITAEATTRSEAIDKCFEFNYVSDVVVSNKTYHTYWMEEPTSSNDIYGVAARPDSGKLYRIQNHKGTYYAKAYDTDTTYSTATTTTNGLMSATDKTNLDVLLEKFKYPCG